MIVFLLALSTFSSSSCEGKLSIGQVIEVALKLLVQSGEFRRAANNMA